MNGRKDIFQKLETKLFERRTPNAQLLWFHCASLGEFEQGRPLIEKLKSQHPSIKILLTFFSPSGYEVRKNYSGANWVFYLPIDTIANAEKFISIIKPDRVFFVKYEFWFNYLNQLKKSNIPTYLISGIFRKEQHFFKSYGNWFKKQLWCFSHFFVQDENSMVLLKSIGYTNVTISGDTRFDRVYEIAQSVKKIDLVNSFVGNNKIIVAGSTWKEDEKIIADWFNKSKLRASNFKLIIAPHEISEPNIQSIIQQFNNSTIVKYSQANEQNIQEAEILIIDNIGMLSSLFQYGTIAFTGGGFGKGIHNILEAATFGLPIIFGPNYKKFVEANELIKLGGAFSITNTIEFEKIMQLLNDQNQLTSASAIAKEYVKSSTGATKKILNFIS